MIRLHRSYSMTRPSPLYKRLIGAELRSLVPVYALFLLTFLSAFKLVALPQNSLFHQDAMPGGRASSVHPRRQLTQAEEERSYYLKWIQQDLSYWQERGGISQQLVDEAEHTLRACPDSWEEGGWLFLRFQVVSGKLFVMHEAPNATGFYPAGYGRGWASAKGRVPYAILALADVLHHFPGEVPDLDAVIRTGDTPCVPRTDGALLPPSFAYNSRADYADIPFPDYSYWGHENNLLTDDEGKPVHGWDEQLDFLATTWMEPLAERQPQVVWRGRYNHYQDWLRRQFLECPQEFYQRNDSRSGGLFNVWNEQSGEIDLRSTCAYRFQAYLESKAWSTNLKQKLACGSVVLARKIQYHEFWTRELQMGRHYLEFKKKDMCQDLVTKMTAMNAFLDNGTDVASLRLPSKERKQEAAATQQQQRRRHLLLDSEGSGASGSASLGLPAADQRPAAAGRHPRQKEQQYSWGSSLTPQQIADEARMFLHEHVRMRDVRLYLRDVLQEYAALQQFQPQPHPQAVCYTGKLLLEAFGTPHVEDAWDVAERYSWVGKWDPGCPQVPAGDGPAGDTEQQADGSASS